MAGWPLRIVVYGAGDAINGSGNLDIQISEQLLKLQQIATNRWVAATAQLDSSTTPAVRFVLDPKGRQPRTMLPDINTGDPQVLIDYVDWARTTCPASRTVLVLSGHGVAWQDALAEEVLATRGVMRGPSTMPRVPAAIHHGRRLFGTGLSPVVSATRAILLDGSNRDFLSNSELGAACEKIATKLGTALDTLVLDACLMSSWEVLEEISSATRTVVCSIDELSAAGIDLARPVKIFSEGRGEFDAIAIARTITEEFVPQEDFDTCVAVDLSSASWREGVANFGSFVEAARSWAAVSAENRDSLRRAIAAAATSVVRYAGHGLADIGAFAQEVGEISALPLGASTAVRGAAAMVKNCVVGRTTGNRYSDSTGVSIFAPASEATYMSNRPEYARLRFATTTGWAKLLDILYVS